MNPLWHIIEWFVSPIIHHTTMIKRFSRIIVGIILSSILVLGVCQILQAAQVLPTDLPFYKGIMVLIAKLFLLRLAGSFLVQYSQTAYPSFPFQVQRPGLEQLQSIFMQRNALMIGILLTPVMVFAFLCLTPVEQFFFVAYESTLLLVVYLIGQGQLSRGLVISMFIFYPLLGVSPTLFTPLSGSLFGVVAIFLGIAYSTSETKVHVLNIVLAILCTVLFKYLAAFHPSPPIIDTFWIDNFISIILLAVIFLTVGYYHTERNRYKLNLQKSHQFLHQVLDHNPHFLFVKDINRRFVFINSAFQQAYYPSGTQVLGKRTEELLQDPQEIDAFIADDLTVIKEGKTIHKVQERITTNEHKQIWVETIKTPLVDEAGNTVGLLGISTDVTEKRTQADIIHQQLIDLDEKNQQLQKYIESNLQLENFAHLASHDLKAPIRTIYSFAQLLNRSAEKKLDKREMEFLNFIISASGNLHQLTKDLLLYSRVGTNKQQFEPVNIRKELAHLIKELQSEIEDSHAVLVVHHMPEQLIADRTLLRQVFQNLISNSIKFVQPGQTPKIHIASFDRPTEWEFCIEDNGIGIDPKYFDRIFGLFRKLHSIDRYEGSGIGLALCKKIVDLHQGRIWLSSVPGEGTKFFFTLSKALPTSEPHVASLASD